MRIQKRMWLRRSLTAFGLALAMVGVPTAEALAHCDAMDGPVVKAARLALEEGKVARALVWVQAEHDAEVRHAFDITRKVWLQGGDARRVAEHHFLETVVRLHRAGEGEPFTGLKPAGHIDPAIAAADSALASGTSANLERMLLHLVRDALRVRFEAALAARKFEADDVTAGRAYVAAYVPLVHYVEQLRAVAGGDTPAMAHPREKH